VSPGLVIFDCDGVLVDSERLTVAVEARVLTQLGWPHTNDDVVSHWMGRTSAEQLSEVTDRLGPEAARSFDEQTTAELEEVFERELRVVAGVEAVLDTLAGAGVSTCVASSGSHAKMRSTLGLTGLYDRFSGRIFSADEVTHGKPAPDLFLHAARAMGAHPSESVVVEDSVYGVRAAVTAQMDVYGFAGGLTSATALAEAGAQVFHEMGELIDLLELRPPEG